MVPNYNPAPRDRVLIAVGWEPALPGHFLPSWRFCTPGYGEVEHACGDTWARFMAFWRGLGWAVRRWDLNGRPGPVFSHLTPSDQQWLTSGGAK